MGIDIDGFGDAGFVATGLTHNEQLISYVCRPCDDVVSLFDVAVVISLFDVVVVV